MNLIPAALAVVIPLLFTRPQADVLAGLAADFSGRREPVRCQAADTNWFTPAGRRVCIWVQGTVTWAPAELSTDGPSGGPFDLLIWAMQRRDSVDVARLQDSLHAAFSKRGLQHYPCNDGAHRWQTADLAVEFHPGARDPNGTIRTSVFAVRNSAALPKILCKDVPDVPHAPAGVMRRGLLRGLRGDRPAMTPTAALASRIDVTEVLLLPRIGISMERVRAQGTRGGAPAVAPLSA